jgi:outer membrane lipoprotein-sorting protein
MPFEPLNVFRFAACVAGAASVAAVAAPAGAVQPAPLATFAQAWQSIDAYSATVTAFERKGSQVVNVTLDYKFRKPSNVLIHIVAGPNAGASLSWNGGETITAWHPGFLSFIKKTFDLHDSYVETTRGASIDELSFGSILAHAEHEAGKLDVAPPDEIGGTPAQVVTLTPADPAHDGGLTREVVELSPATHLPMRVLGYEGATLVRKIDFDKVTVDD